MLVIFGITIFLFSFIFGFTYGTGNLTRSGIIGVVVSDRLYFTDATKTLYTWEEAREYCRLEGGELAKVINKTLYDFLRSSLSLKSSKPIGLTVVKLKVGTDLILIRPVLQIIMWNYSTLILKMFENDLKSKRCLALVKGKDLHTSKLQSLDCILPNRVLCALPLNGCMMSGD